MNKGSGATASVWMETAGLVSRTALDRDVTADVCVVGAGVAGLTTAYTEKTWDCPCHGSRFDPFGKVLNGPANTALGPAE